MTHLLLFIGGVDGKTLARRKARKKAAKKARRGNR